MDNYKEIKEAIVSNAKEYNVSVIELCNDMAYVIDLSSEYNITFLEAIKITNRIELEES